MPPTDDQDPDERDSFSAELDALTAAGADTETVANRARELLLERAPDPYKAVLKFRQELTPESDRGCALMAAAFLDDALRGLLEKSFVDDARSSKRILEGGGTAPLATLSAKIDMAYLMGLIDRRVRQDIHLIRKIRNDFAHSGQPMQFSEPSIRSRCSALSLVGPVLDPSSPRARFTSAVMGCLANVHASTGRTARPTPTNVPMPPDESQASQD